MEKGSKKEINRQAGGAGRGILFNPNPPAADAQAGFTTPRVTWFDRPC